MKKYKAILLISLIAFSAFYFYVSPTVKADNGKAQVYIICLSGVGGWKPGQVYDPTETKTGAVDALLFKETNCIPWVHPKYGKYAPFYRMDYQVVTDWSTYKTIIESSKEIIVVNTHGEITPIPNGYTKETWTDKIGEAMNKRGITWVHTAGYPFFYSWDQGAGDKQQWGEAGFQRLMSTINKGSVTLPYDQETTKIDMNLMAINTLLSGGWNDLSNARRAERGRPLRGSDFKDYTILPIWGTRDDYMTGAIIAFVKPSQRVAPQDRNKFGAFVHIGAEGTFTAGDIATNGNYWRGYAGMAAAIWSEVQSFGTTGTHEVLTHDNYGLNIPYGYYAEFSLMVTPVITWYTLTPDNYYQIDTALGIFACMKTNCSEGFGNVYFYLDPMSSDVQVMTNTAISQNGYRYNNPTMTGKYWDAGKTILDTALFLIDVAGVFTANPEALALTQALGGVSLFSDWIDLLSTGAVTDTTSGVNQWASHVEFTYNPQIGDYISLPGGYMYAEFESLIHIQYQVNAANFRQWTMLPVDWYVEVRDWYQGAISMASGDSTMAMFTNHGITGYETTAFYDDFEGDLSGWSIGDTNSASGYDYWGIFDAGGVDAHQLYCATVGTNSLYNERPNIIADPYQAEWLAYRYDKDMNAYATATVDLRPYQSAKLCYYICSDLFGNEGDYTVVEYGINGAWTELVRYTGPDGGWKTYTIPTATTQIRFRFVSNSDSSVSWGAFIDNVQIKAVLQNDAGSGGDAPDNFGQALFENQGSYGGYLNYDEDWYKFTVSTSDITAAKAISVSLTAPSDSMLVELRNPNNVVKAGPAVSVNYQLSSSDVPGDWRIRIYPNRGFGQYTLTFSIYTPSHGGGGCPYILVWNGHRFTADNNLLPASENNDGSDVRDSYILQTTPTPMTQTKSLSLFTFKINEFEHELSYIDQVKFMAIDHASDVNVATTPEGNIVTYRNPMRPLSCKDNLGNDALNKIGSMDGDLFNADTYFQGYAGDYLILNFGKIESSHSKLILRDDQKCCDICIVVQVPDANGHWQTIETLHPREKWAIEAVDLTGYVPKNEDLMVKLLWTATHRLDYVGLDDSYPEPFTVRSGVLVSATHSANGNVLSQLKNSDNHYAQLSPGQTISLTFALRRSETAEATTYLFYSEGHYYTMP